MVSVYIYIAGFALVCQQSVWGADGYREAVPQSLVHSASLSQLWPLLCGPVGHDQDKSDLRYHCSSTMTIEVCRISILFPWLDRHKDNCNNYISIVRLIIPRSINKPFFIYS